MCQTVSGTLVIVGIDQIFQTLSEEFRWIQILQTLSAELTTRGRMPSYAKQFERKIHVRNVL